MALYPLFLNLENAPVLIVGGGRVALRKTRGLLESHARVTLVSPEWESGFEELTGIERRSQKYDSALMSTQPWRLIFAATNNLQVNQQVAADARSRNILCCRCDDGSAGDFIGAATRGDQQVRLAISSHGASPALAARLADQAWQGIDPLLLQWVTLLESWRPQITATLAGDARAALLKRVTSDEMEQILRTGGISAAQKAFDHWLTRQP